MKQNIIFCMILFFAFPGCSWFQARDEKTAYELAEEGMSAYEDGKYRPAIESFEKLKDWYPFSEYASLAALKIADAHFHLGEYDEAIFAYEGFETLHPRNEAIPYVIYQIGTSYYRQRDTIDRDQKAVRQALDTYRRLIRDYPKSEYSAKAEGHLKECLKSLAGHEFYVGLFYFKNKKYEPALSRFKTILTEYPDVGIHQKALHYLALCEASLKKQRQNN
jgi:outer membrane protein assembly factor BamD